MLQDPKLSSMEAGLPGNMQCIICQNSSGKKISDRVRDSQKHTVTECSRCYHVQLTPIPSENDNEDFYNEGLQFKNIDEPTELDLIRKNQKTDTIRRSKFVANLLSNHSEILDIGAGFGFFVEELRKQGFRPTGIEISAFARTIARKVTHVELLNIDILSSSFNRQFDALTLFHVLEHISKPIEFLIKLKSNLRGGGRLIIEVPNLDDLMVTSNAAYRNFYWQRAHLSYFNTKTLKMVLKKAGFTQLKFYYYQRYGIDNFMNWMVTGKPQLSSPSFTTKSNYKWLEQYYKEYLIKSGKSDTLLAVTYA